MKDVLLSRIGKDIVGGMVKQARAKKEPEEETKLPTSVDTPLKLKHVQDKLEKQVTQNMVLKQENTLKATSGC